MDCIAVLEHILCKKAELELLPLQLGDVPDTYADMTDLFRQFDFRPNTSIEQGLTNFVAWYRNYFKV
jgi:UDP-glucuronate 4-epimerase